ncbi:MAG: helix-turn-helix domain-containing protein [Acidobacteriota bacterium]
MDANQRKRLKWIYLYEKYGSAGKACLKCGISRPTLHKWLRLYEQQGIGRTLSLRISEGSLLT